MAHQFTTSYLEDSIELFRYYKKLAKRALEQCPDVVVFTSLDEESNSIAITVKHMAGNMKSRWVNFLTTDGEKPNRNRDSEFKNGAQAREALLATWETGWNYLFAALAQLKEEDLSRTVTIRAQPHSVMQAINRQIAHYSYHVGQIIFLAKHFAANSGKWAATTVPRGQSQQFASDVVAGKKSQR